MTGLIARKTGAILSEREHKERCEDREGEVGRVFFFTKREEKGRAEREREQRLENELDQGELAQREREKQRNSNRTKPHIVTTHLTFRRDDPAAGMRGVFRPSLHADEGETRVVVLAARARCTIHASEHARTASYATAEASMDSRRDA